MHNHQSTSEFEINLTQSLCKLTEKWFSYIIKKLLNWYWQYSLISINSHITKCDLAGRRSKGEGQMFDFWSWQLYVVRIGTVNCTASDVNVTGALT